MAPNMDKLWSAVNACIDPDERQRYIRTAAGIRASGRSFKEFSTLLSEDYREAIVLLDARVLFVSPPRKTGLLRTLKALKAAGPDGNVAAAIDHRDWPRASVHDLTVTTTVPYDWRLVGDSHWLEFYTDQDPEPFRLWVDAAHCKSMNELWEYTKR